MGTATRPLRVMLDTTVLVAGSGWPRWPHEVLLAALNGAFELVLCPYLLEEARRVVAKRFPPEHLARLDEFLDETEYTLAPDPTYAELASHAGLVRDAADLPIVIAALNAGVDYLVSEDKDLTSHSVLADFQGRHLAVVLSGTFLREALGWSSADLERLRSRTWSDVESDTGPARES